MDTRGENGGRDKAEQEKEDKGQRTKEGGKGNEDGEREKKENEYEE